MTALESWRRTNRLTYRALGALYGVSTWQAYRHCLPADHKHARLPGRAEMARIVELTKGAVRPDDFYALGAAAPQAEAAE